jgi:hypothetical protein
MIRIIFIKILYVIAFCLIFLVMLEGLTRYQGQKDDNKYRYDKVLRPRLWKSWLNEGNKNPLLPPFRVFKNSDFSNPDRLRLIANEALLPKDTSLQAHDFLRAESLKSQTRYHVRTNGHGLRQNSPVQGHNLFKIVCLGSYHTFGHGLNDNQTFPFYLQKFLNERSANTVYSVQNAGRQAATAIVGLSLLEKIFLEQQPNVIVWDFGFVDSAVWEDDLIPVVMLFPDTAFSKYVKKFFSYFLSKSYALAFFLEKVKDNSTENNIEEFKVLTTKMLKLAEQKKMRVLLVRNTKVGPKFPKTLYQELADSYEGATFVDYNQAFIENPPSQQVRQRFESSDNWTKEFDGNKLVEGPYFQPQEYHLNVYQYNADGQRAIAEHLTKVLLQGAK